MKTRFPFAALVIVALMGCPAAHAETPVAVQNEVNFLLGYIAGGVDTGDIGLHALVDHNPPPLNSHTQTALRR